MRKKELTISVGIPTYEAGESLVVTLQSLYNQTTFNKIKEIIVAVDGNSVKSEILQKIKNSKLRIIYFRKREGQAKRMNDLFSKVKTDLLFITNDDIIVDRKAVENVLRSNNFDLLMGDVVGLNPKSLLEKIILVGTNINKHIRKSWNNGDNYLSCNGRLVVLSKNLYQNIHIPLQNWNSDAYMYLLAKENNYLTIYQESVKAYFKVPEVLTEHLRQSDKFQLSRKENQKYFKNSISDYYSVPLKLKLVSIFKELIKNPAYLMGYFFIYLYTRMHMKSYDLFHSRFWETDKSTKVIKLKR